MGQVALLGGLPRLVYSIVLTADAATLDTGANAIPAGYNILEIFAVVRTDEVAVASNIGVRFNGDGNANYNRSAIGVSNTSVTGAANTAQTSIPTTIPAASSAAAIAGAVELIVPDYVGTTFNKAGNGRAGNPDSTAANMRDQVFQFAWLSTAAINQVTFIITSGVSQKFKAGSALYVYVR